MIQKKVCLLGASGVGKTSLVRQYVEGIFSDKYLTSIGVKIDKKTVDVDGGMVQLMLWDIEGVDCYAGFNPRYLRGAASAIIVVDHTRPQSFLDGAEICRMVRQTAAIPSFLVINKSDLPQADTWCDGASNDAGQLFLRSFQTSAKTGAGVEAMFFDVARLIVDQ